MADNFSNGGNLDLNALAVVTFTDLCRKICDDNDDVNLGHSLGGRG